ncbi:hypothetical protein [Spirosoma endophyticum]|nr:hypothetical protein [Spirosoma endophyticum]
MKRPIDKQQEHEWIEQYLSGEMTRDERKEVEMVMQADADFEKEVQLLKRTHELMKEAFLEQRAVATLRQLQRQSRQRTQRIRLVRRSLIGSVTAGFMLIVYLSVAPVVFPDSENDTSITHSLADESDTMAVAQKQVFNQFFEGQVHLIEGQYVLAVKNFETVVRTTDIRPYFREAAQWHLTVAYLKSGEPHKAERVYDQFSQCTDCEYPIRAVDRWKIWWQIKWAQWLK